MRRAVKVADVGSHPYVNGGPGTLGSRLDNPARRDKYPYLCVDYDTREICITKTLRVPLEGVKYYDLVDEDEETVQGEIVSVFQARTMTKDEILKKYPRQKRTWSPERRAAFEKAKANGKAG